MKGVYWENGIWQQALGGILGCVGAIANIITPAFAQVIADPSLGTRVNQNDLIYQITGGTTVGGTNLFHSFSRFDVPDGGVADFLNTNSIVNIFSRVTGGTPSDIQGLIRAQGSANLFLMNPAGIVFGRNAQLDVGGSFVATTADGIAFGERGVFSASESEAPQLLTVNPSAFLFNNIANQPTNSIESKAFLSVPLGRSLLLVGGNIAPNLESTGKIVLNGGRLRASGGRVEIGGLGEPGKITLNTIGSNFSLEFPEDIKRVDVSIINLAEVDVTAGAGGDISIYSQNLDILDGSDICAGIGTDVFCGGLNSDNGFLGSQAGDIKLDALENITISDPVSEVRNNVNPGGFGNSGKINIKAKSVSVTDDSKIISSTFGTGNSGDVIINTEKLIVENSQVGASIFGSGKAGNLIIRASIFVDIQGDFLAVQDEEIGFPGGLFSQINPDGRGQGGNITIETKRLSISDGSKIQVATFGEGDAGNIIIRAEEIDLFETPLPNLFSTGIFAGVEKDAREPNSAKGNGGNITIETERLSMAGRTLISSEVSENSVGNGGDISVATKILLIKDGAQIFTLTQGQGNAGNITINAGDIEMTNFSFINSGIRPGGIGKGGNINIQTDSISLLNGSQINSFIFGQQRDEQGNIIAPGGIGNAGNIKITADTVTLSGMDPDGFSSAIFTISERGSSGSPGDIHVKADNLQVKNGAIIGASTSNASDGGEIFIDTTNFEAINGGQIVTATRSSGNAGTIIFNATENVKLSGLDPNFEEELDRAKKFILNNPSERFEDVSDIVINEGAASGIFANTASNSTGNGGTINLRANSLSVNNNARISARSQGTGKAGDITINTNQGFHANNGEVITTAQQEGGGKITITSQNIRLFGDSDIRTNVFSGDGGGGNIDLKADSIIAFDDSDILAFARDGQGGDITLNTPAFFGENYQPAPKGTDPASLDGNNRVDINASGAVSGVIILPDTTFIQNSLTELQQNPIDTKALIANSCIARSSKVEGTFMIIGSGGLPNRPGDAFVSPYPTGTVQGVTPSTLSWKKGDPIIEPTGVYRLANGQLVMSRECL
ncbi:MAG: filamentous hemagglutinin N-terminal domain-containing protein [Moorea sp. SIO4A3]|nr:filamentous hemagglutinin N-terminal domain-containing protein [Moorena sp. SIO4A3]